MRDRKHVSAPSATHVSNLPSNQPTPCQRQAWKSAAQVMIWCLGQKHLEEMDKSARSQVLQHPFPLALCPALNAAPLRPPHELGSVASIRAEEIVAETPGAILALQNAAELPWQACQVEGWLCWKAAALLCFPKSLGPVGFCQWRPWERPT